MNVGAKMAKMDEGYEGTTPRRQDYTIRKAASHLPCSPA